MSYKLGDQVVFVEKASILLMNSAVVHIPAGTRGVIKSIDEMDRITQVLAERDNTKLILECYPETIGFPLFIHVVEDDDRVEEEVEEDDDEDGEKIWDNICLVADAPSVFPSLEEQDIYDEYMPGFLRAVDEYVMPEPDSDDEDEYLLFMRKAWTPWMVELHFYPGSNPIDEVDAVFRTTWGDGRECEQLSILMKDSEFLMVQVQIMSATRFRTYAYVPAEVKIDARKKKVIVYFLCKVTITDRDVVITHLSDEL